MKHILWPILLSLALHAQGQGLEEFKRRVIALETQQVAIQDNLARAHKQYSTGTMIQAAGIVLTVAGGLIFSHRLLNNNYYDPKTGERIHGTPYIMYAGVVMTTAGTIIQVDSHKWIGRAGQRRR